MILEDNRFCLRPVEPEDADFMWSVECDSLQWIQNLLVAPFSRENLRNYALNYEADPYEAGQLRLIMIEKHNGRRVGIIDLYDLIASQRTAWVGIYILPEFRGKDIGKTGLHLLEDYAIRILNLRRLGAKIIENNESSMNLFLNSGFEWIGRLPGWIQSGKELYSIHILQKSLS